jgi:hypothetical protein
VNPNELQEHARQFSPEAFVAKITPTLGLNGDVKGFAPKN